MRKTVAPDSQPPIRSFSSPSRARRRQLIVDADRARRSVATQIAPCTVADQGAVGSAGALRGTLEQGGYGPIEIIVAVAICTGTREAKERPCRRVESVHLR